MGWRVSKSENPNAEFDIFWADIGIDSERLASLKPYQKTNHFPAMFQITRKTFLAKNLKRLQKLYPLEFDFFPKTWVLPNELNDLSAYGSEKAKKAKAGGTQKQPSKELNSATPTPANNQPAADATGTRAGGHDDPSRNGYVTGTSRALPRSAAGRDAD